LGWFTYWLLHRFTRVTGGDIAGMDILAQALHDAEETRDQAILYLEQREAELMDQIAQIDAELTATLESLQDARNEVDDLSAYIARIKARS
jgi:peptidoglycan hydrolase CwlO-like protein